MAKGQKRGNRETRKPKVAKPAPAPAASLMTRGMLTPISNTPPKKKG